MIVNNIIYRRKYGNPFNNSRYDIQTVISAITLVVNVILVIAVIAYFMVIYWNVPL